MRTYKMRGLDLYNAQNRKVAIVRGESIYDANYQRVGAIRGDDLFDSDGRMMMTVRDREIFDGDNKKVGDLSETQESIDGILEGMLCTALWYCFVR